LTGASPGRAIVDGQQPRGGQLLYEGGYPPVAGSLRGMRLFDAAAKHSRRPHWHAVELPEGRRGFLELNGR